MGYDHFGLCFSGRNGIGGISEHGYQLPGYAGIFLTRIFLNRIVYFSTKSAMFLFFKEDLGKWLSGWQKVNSQSLRPW